MTTTSHDDGSVGRAGFVARHELWDDQHREAHRRSLQVMEERGIDLVRVSFPDQHGILRGKTLTVETYEQATRGGYSVPSTLIAKDTSGRTIFPVFRAGAGIDLPQLTGVADLVLVPDPSTFRVLPWTPRTAWVLCDIHFTDGTPAPFSTRHLLRRVLGDLDATGHRYVVGLELEFHVYRLEDPHLHPDHTTWPGRPPTVSPLAHGFQLVADDRIDQVDHVVRLLHEGARALDLPVRSFELELGPSQLEATFAPQEGLRAADDAVLFRSAVKQLCRRHGLHATFMCRPALPNTFSSGWHLHQSLRGPDGANAFTAHDGALLSTVGRQFLGGLVAHARAATAFTTPTINGYKRYRPYSLAPDRVVWGIDNKGAMLRVVGLPGDPGTRIENRTGEPAANPYLYLASQVAAGLDGIESDLDPGPATEEPYDTDAPRLPSTLMEAVDALATDEMFPRRFGSAFVDYHVAVKRAEIQRYLEAVTDWEQQEYFDMY